MDVSTPRRSAIAPLLHPVSQSRRDLLPSANTLVQNSPFANPGAMDRHYTGRRSTAATPHTPHVVVKYMEYFYFKSFYFFQRPSVLDLPPSARSNWGVNTPVRPLSQPRDADFVNTPRSYACSPIVPRSSGIFLKCFSLLIF
jgi:hypothetical protein